MFDMINKLNKNQKGIASLALGVVLIVFAQGIIPGLPTFLSAVGIVLIALGLYTLEVYTKIMALISKK